METVIQAEDLGGQSENDGVSALDLRAAMGTFNRCDHCNGTL